MGSGQEGRPGAHGSSGVGSPMAIPEGAVGPGRAAGVVPGPLNVHSPRVRQTLRAPSALRH